MYKIFSPLAFFLLCAFIGKNIEASIVQSQVFQKTKASSSFNSKKLSTFSKKSTLNLKATNSVKPLQSSSLNKSKSSASNKSKATPVSASTAAASPKTATTTVDLSSLPIKTIYAAQVANGATQASMGTNFKYSDGTVEQSIVSALFNLKSSARGVMTADPTTYMPVLAPSVRRLANTIALGRSTTADEATVKKDFPTVNLTTLKSNIYTLLRYDSLF